MASLEDIGTQEARDELALLAHKLSVNPKTRKDFLKLAQQENPNIPMPELMLEEKIDASTKMLDDKFAAFEAKLSEKEMRAELDRRRQSIIDSGKATKDDIEAIEKVMMEKGITNHESGAEYFAWMQQASRPTPVAYDRNVIDAGTKDRLAPYMKNPVFAAREEAAKAFAEYRKNPKVAG